VLSRQVVEPALDRQCRRGLHRIRGRIEHGQRLVHVGETTGVGIDDEGSGGLGLQPRARDGILRQGQRPLEVLLGCHEVAADHAGLSRGLLQLGLLRCPAQGLRALRGAAVGGDRLVVGEERLRVRARPPGPVQAALVISASMK
jgi:hypothetical protein